MRPFSGTVSNSHFIYICRLQMQLNKISAYAFSIITIYFYLLLFATVYANEEDLSSSSISISTSSINSITYRIITEIPVFVSFVIKFFMVFEHFLVV